MKARTSWDQVYEQLSRRWSAVGNKSLPQNRARFFEEAIEIVAEARKEMQSSDDMSERNFARCLERVAQYVEMPSTLVATLVLQRAGEL
jgi:vacuolar-type H+-ATPase subunit H